MRQLNLIIFFLGVIGFLPRVAFCDTLKSPSLYLPLLHEDFPKVRDFAKSPSGNEIYFSVASYKNELSFIFYITQSEGKWSKPKLAGFSGSYNDIEPAFSPDGLKMYFSSKRPISDSSSEPKDYDIWYVERENESDAWGKPQNVGSPVNTKENEFYPSVSKSGNLYFTGKREDVKGGEDLYVSYPEKGKHTTPVNLGDSINSEKFEFNAYVAPDESFILFSSFGRPDGYGGGDLYISYRNAAGHWGKAQNLGNKINSKALDYCPFYDAENELLYFTSQRSNYPKYLEGSIDEAKIIKLLSQKENGLDKIYVSEYQIEK